MNKIQFIKLLEMRGITKLENISVAEAVRQTGGEPTLNEMVKVNELSMIYYIDKFEDEKQKNDKLQKQNNILDQQIEKSKDRNNLLSCLEAAGVDNWSGYEYAIELYNELNSNL